MKHVSGNFGKKLDGITNGSNKIKTDLIRRLPETS